MRTIICVLAALILAGCWEAEPDRDSLGELRNTVASFPVEVKGVMSRWAANRVAYGYMLNSAQRGDDHLGTIRCIANGAQHFSDPVFDIQVSDMLLCLTRMGTTPYLGCLDVILSDKADEHPDRECSWIGHRTGLAPDEIPDDFRADRISDDEIAWALVGLPPPPKEIQILLLGLPGMLGRAGALCIQAKRDWACAPNPFDAEPGTSSAATGGGDR